MRLRLEHRGGKSAAINLGLSACTGDIVVISDVDTTFDRSAFAELLGYFADPRVGAVSGSLGVRNASASLITRHQAIEYAIGIALGRIVQDSLGILSIVSGAFGAFRRAALEQVGGQDVEVGEDADLTMKLRRAGWRILFVLHSTGAAPLSGDTLGRLVQQANGTRRLCLMTSAQIQTSVR
jgi:poly-beta-1,6-N-acetyl-D-glucosamine synthase